MLCAMLICAHPHWSSGRSADVRMVTAAGSYVAAAAAARRPCEIQESKPAAPEVPLNRGPPPWQGNAAGTIS